MPLLRLFLIFTKVGAILLGGGYVILPILTSEFCDKRNLIKNEELVDYFALSQSLPGMIAANMSIFMAQVRGSEESTLLELKKRGNCIREDLRNFLKHLFSMQ